MIKLKKEHARAFFPSYGDMADAFARNEVVVSCLGWEAVAVWAKAKGKEIKLYHPEGGHRPVHGLPGHPEGRTASRSHLQDDQSHPVA